MGRMTYTIGQYPQPLRNAKSVCMQFELHCREWQSRCHEYLSLSTSSSSCYQCHSWLHLGDLVAFWLVLLERDERLIVADSPDFDKLLKHSKALMFPRMTVKTYIQVWYCCIKYFRHTSRKIISFSTPHATLLSQILGLNFLKDLK